MRPSISSVTAPAAGEHKTSTCRCVSQGYRGTRCLNSRSLLLILGGHKTSFSDSAEREKQNTFHSAAESLIRVLNEDEYRIANRSRLFVLPDVESDARQKNKCGADDFLSDWIPLISTRKSKYTVCPCTVSYHA